MTGTKPQSYWKRTDGDEMPRIQAILLITLVLGAFACGPKTAIPDPQPLPAGQSWAGVWYSPQFEHMYLRQQGDAVNGIYAYKFGGTLEGEANGNVMKFQWLEPGDKSEARREVKGKGWLQLVKEGEKVKLKGEWGYNDAYSGGGIWEAEWVRPMDADDPRSLEQWKEMQGLTDE